MSADPGSSLGGGRSTRRILVYDCRDQNNVEKKLIETSGLDYNDFRRDLRKKFAIRSDETFVVTTTDRTVIDFDRFGKLQDGITLYLLQRKEQVLPVAVEEEIKFMPHYDTLLQSGMDGYYANDGQNPLPYALAELIDNSLSATTKIQGTRIIEIRMMFDETLGKPAVIVLDNGCGMTPQQLNNWAVYRLSKFTRENSTFASLQEKYVPPCPVPRSLNSDISYFGVGGKQAAFFIGTSTRMISKSAGSPDVHELLLSKEDFKRKERNKEDIYSTTIKNRKPCDASHVRKNEERFLRELIAEEKGKESFTAVVITDVQTEHIKYLKQGFTDWTRRLAHIYHYYIHGVNGNDMKNSSTNPDLSKIDIQITLREKPPKIPCVMNLREVEDDMQTLYINAAADTFEFKASVEADCGTVEGILRYHPFLYDRETYPKESPAVQAESDDEDDGDYEPGARARGKRPIFECFWNGRLIPYTKIDELEWCTRPKGKDLPPECYSRFSGVLFTDDKFEVNTTKLTFSDLELKLKKKETIFTYVANERKPQRANIQSKFTDWLKNCHVKFDKQIQFLGYKGVISREDVRVKKMQHPWSTFSTIKCGGNTYKTGQLVKSKNTAPIYCGTVIRFLVYGEHKAGDFATGGQVEMDLEPKGLYDKTKVVPISKIDMVATDDSIQKIIDSNLVKLPHKLKVEWPENNAWSQNDVHPAGAQLGPLKIEILNNKGESLSTMPAMGKHAGTKLSVRLSITHHAPKQTQEVASFTAQWSAKWAFWFKKNENLTKLGNYTLHLNAMINEKTNYGGRELPRYTLKFSIKASSASSFVIDATSPTLQVGVPFDLSLKIRDYYGHAATAPPNVLPVLECSDLDVTHESVDSSETTFTIKNVRARGKVQQRKTYDLSVTLPGLDKETKTMTFSLLPGPSRSLHVTPGDSLITVENGTSVRFNVEIHDEAGNVTTCPKHVVRCQGKDLPPVDLDCSRTGVGQLETKPIKLNIINGEPQKLQVQLNVPNQKNITSVVRKLMVIPSTRVSVIKLYSEDDENLVLRNNDKIEWLAGGLLENLVYKLYDEAGREVPLTSKIASMIKVNWTRDLILEDLVQGKLPDVQVPTRVQEERSYQVSYHDQSVSVFFTITPRPDEPAQLKATLSKTRVKLGETLSENINLELVDRYGNATKTLDPSCVNSITVKAEDVDQSAVTCIWQESSCSVEVAGVCFQGGAPGPRELCFTYGSYKGFVIVTLTAGDPAELKLISGPDQVLNDNGIPKPFLVQLFDKWGNSSSDQRVVVEVKSSPPTLKVTTTVTSQPVDAEGKASFTVTSVSGTKGYYQLKFIGSLNMKPLPGPSVNLIVLPNPNKPVRLSVEYDTSATFPAGGTFPSFSVTVESDEGSPMTTFSPSAITMLLREGVASEGTVPIELKCTKPLENDRKDCFHFRGKETPERAGKHFIQFRLRTETTFLESRQILINVVANQPVRLIPDSMPPPAVVSCSKDITNRTLVQNMTLRIMDAYGNPAGQDLNGTVVVSIKNHRGDSDTNLLFESRSNSQPFKLVEGKVHIPRLAIMENCPGEDGSTYTLLFKPEVLMVPQPLEPFELLLHFYNDVANQKKMFELSKKRKELTDVVSKYSSFFKESQQLLQVLTSRKQEANRRISHIKEVLDTKKMIIARTSNIRDIDRFIREKETEAEAILKRSERIFSVSDPFRGQQGVLGMVGHLAYVGDAAAACVISWHLKSYMDCVITRTTESAKTIHKDTHGRQKVMALDSIYVSPDNRPLPHIRNGCQLFAPPGNPVFARDVLIFPDNKQECETVFRNILGNTILIDDLESATSYRRGVVQNKGPCPTILTKQGDTVSSTGMFGGSQNKLPPVEKIKVFGSPPPLHYYLVKEQIDLAYQYQGAVKKHEEAAKECDDFSMTMKSPDTLEKQKDMESKRSQLDMIEKQLASTPVRPGKRGHLGSGEPSGIDTKRTRQRPT